MAATFRALGMRRQAGRARTHLSGKADWDSSITHSTKTWWANGAAFLQQNAFVCLMVNNTLDKFKWELKCPFPREFTVERKISHTLFPCFSFQFCGVEEVGLLIVHPVNRGSSTGGDRWQGAVPTSPHIRAWKTELVLGGTFQWVGKEFAGKKVIVQTGSFRTKWMVWLGHQGVDKQFLAVVSSSLHWPLHPWATAWLHIAFHSSASTW